jgi:hypothetical protein
MAQFFSHVGDYILIMPSSSTMNTLRLFVLTLYARISH